MAQEHGDRLTAVDASFIAQEGPTAHMHVGAVMIFEGAAPDYDHLADHVRSRLHLVPRFRQKLAFPPVETGRPLWIDDASFNLEYHVRDTALPAPARRRSSALSPRACTRRPWTAPSRCGRCGSCTGSTAAASRSSPRPTTRSSTASRASTSPRCCST